MSTIGRPQKDFRTHPASIDLDAVRDTLRYIEDDLKGTSQHPGLRAILGQALAEISRIETAQSQSNELRQPCAVRFVPARP